jgi:hypothetical protein
MQEIPTTTKRSVLQYVMTLLAGIGAFSLLCASGFVYARYFQ